MRSSIISSPPQPALMEERRSGLRSIIRRLLYVLAFAYIAGTIFGGIGLGWIALHPYSHSVMPSEERNARAIAEANQVEFRDVELTTPDGALLSAWFMRPPEPNITRLIPRLTIRAISLSINNLRQTNSRTTGDGA